MLPVEVQVDRQAINRAHRLGQLHPVRIFRLVSVATVDEAIVASAARKSALGNANNDNNNNKKKKVTRETAL